jgi:hypothetical protein
MGCTLFTHIQIIADQEAPVADQSFADGTVVEMLCRIPNSRLSCCPEFLLIASFEDDTLSFRWGCDPRLGKANRLTAELCSAGAASNAKEEHFPGG